MRRGVTKYGRLKRLVTVLAVPTQFADMSVAE
jgi:hypothetical protein